MILRLLAAALMLSQAAPKPAVDVRALVPGGSLQDSIAGGERRVYSIEVPAQSAARVVLEQDGIDVGYTLRRGGSNLPEHGLNMVAGLEGEELIVAPIEDAPATWNIVVNASLPRAALGRITLSFDLTPADDRARAVAAARQVHQRGSDAAWGGDAKSFQQARALYEEASAAAAAAGDAALAAEAMFQCARVNDSLGDVPAALERQKLALGMFRALGRRDREARVLNRLGDLSRRVGDVAESERYFQQALVLARQTADPETLSDILNNSAILLTWFGRYEEAIEQLESALPLAREINSANVEGALEFNIADAYWKLGVYDKAIARFQRAYVVVQRLGLPRRLGRNMHFQAAVYFEWGDRARAEEAIRKALELFVQAGDRTYEAESLAFLGQMQHANGDVDAALATFARALPVVREVRSRGFEAAILAEWAEIDTDRGDINAALSKLDEALGLSRLIGNPGVEQTVLSARARALQKAGRIGEAIASIAAAIDSVEGMRGAIRRSELRTSYLATVRGYFDLYIDLLQQNGDASGAFEASERGRARALLDALAESATKIHKGVDPALLAQLHAVQASLNAKELNRAQVVMASGQKSPRAVAVGRDIERLLDEWNGVRAKIRDASPAYWDLQKPDAPSVERVQSSLLDADSVLIEYHLGATRSYAWVIDRQSVSSYELAPSATINDVARRYHELLSRETEALPAGEREKLGKDIATLGSRLAEQVWKPIESRARGKRLLIAADGVLQYVPFAALPSSTGQPLIAAHEIAYLPSASVMETIRQRSRPIRTNVTAAVFADPVFSRNDSRFAGQRDLTAPAQTRASDGGLYGRLRFSRQEAEAIGAVSNGAFQALDFVASKQTVAGRDLRKYGILHFATHGSLNTEHPELSGLVFSLVDTAGQPVDGFLRLHEIYNLDLDADLVVLSACRTALGKEIHGEGLIGLTRGFMYAGASRVVSSVWNVDDRASARLMTGFYEAMLSKGRAPASALRDAQLAMLRDPRWSNPHYWAAFGLQGEWK